MIQDYLACPYNLDYDIIRSLPPRAMAPAAQHLPVKAILEGPSACFRLLDINESLGMKHAEYIGLLYSATDNRYRTLCIDVLWKAPWGGGLRSFEKEKHTNLACQ